ncbi:hypothetical protein [Xanthobacter versatilis]|uniref:hypothetical protein n=1 Tax=Xanthobacter autotrophicus (strain ATCC BAA-1158 / Py2) TaxID=78245 RepID=UPI003728474B
MTAIPDHTIAKKAPYSGAVASTGDPLLERNLRFQPMEMKMRHQTFGAIALATTVLTAGAAMGADEHSRAQADAEAQGMYYTGPYAQPNMRYRELGYSRGVELREDPFTQMRVIVIEPTPRRIDDEFIDQGDRGLGNN